MAWALCSGYFSTSTFLPSLRSAAGLPFPKITSYFFYWHDRLVITLVIVFNLSSAQLIPPGPPSLQGREGGRVRNKLLAATPLSNS